MHNLAVKGAGEPATPDLRDEKATPREAHSSDASPDRDKFSAIQAGLLVMLTFSLAPVSVPNRHCRGPLRQSRGLLQHPVGLLEARNVVLAHNVRITRRDATLGGRIRIMGTCGAVLVKHRVCGQIRRFARGYHCNRTRLGWLSLGHARVRI